MSVEKFTVTKEDTCYTILPNSVLQNLFDLEVLGLWCYFQSKPPQWEFYKDEIRGIFNVGINKFDSLLASLKKYNLIEMKQERNKKGCFSDWSLHVKNGNNFIPFNENHETDNHRSMKTVGTVTVGTENSTYKRKIEKRKIEEKKELILPNWISDKIWEDFIAHRKSLKAPLSDKAKQLAITSLTKLKAQGQNTDDVINQTILNGWKGFFPVRKDSQGGHYGNKRKSNAGLHFESCKDSLKGTIYDEDCQDPFGEKVS